MNRTFSILLVSMVITNVNNHSNVWMWKYNRLHTLFFFAVIQSCSWIRGGGGEGYYLRGFATKVLTGKIKSFI